MTSEICLMNRSAVVLAADSATTVTRWNNGQREERYFKGANKIFQLSEHHPIGVMIFDSAEFLSTPWETIIKKFRLSINSRQFDTISDCAEHFFEYLSDNKLFPEKLQTDELMDSFFRIAFSDVSELKDKRIKKDRKNLQKHLNKLTAETIKRTKSDIQIINNSTETDDKKEKEINQKIKEITNLNYDNFIENIPSVMQNANDRLKNIFNFFKLEIPDDLDDYITSQLEFIFFNSYEIMSTTGFVFAGFGEEQDFPEVTEFETSGMFFGKINYRPVSKQCISHSMPTHLQAFAQKSMIDTFQLGLSVDIFSSIGESICKHANHMIETMQKDGDAAENGRANPETLSKELAKSVSKEVIAGAVERHSIPFRTVLGFLPVDEMADLAETMVRLQSLKEKVTKPTESVGGPIDVAIITKFEGLVWIKRKHFFDSELNSRYRLRQEAQHRR